MKQYFSRKKGPKKYLFKRYERFETLIVNLFFGVWDIKKPAHTANVKSVNSTDNPCTDPCNIWLANRSYMPKLSMFAGFVVSLITGKYLHILMMQVLQML